MDSTSPSEQAPQNSEGPNLLWTPELDETISYWQRTGNFPFPDLRLQSPEAFRNLCKDDLRLVYHLASIHQEMERNDYLQCTFWASDIPV